MASRRMVIRNGTIASTRQGLKEEIRAAFGSVPFPAHQGLRGSMARDTYATDAEVRAITADQDIHGDWWQIPQMELRECALALSYLDAAGASFYLPAYFDMALDDVRKRRLWILDLIDTTHGDEVPGLRAYLEGRLSQLNDGQRTICVRVLQVLRAHLIDDISGQHEREHIERILQDSFWHDAVTV